MGRFSLRVAMSVCLCVCVSLCLFALSGVVVPEASYWPWYHMISSRPLIDPPSPPLKTPPPKKIKNVDPPTNFVDHLKKNSTLQIIFFVTETKHIHILIRPSQQTFSPTRPSGPSWTSSRDVCLRPSPLSPSHAVFFKASHWPSVHMISSRPVIGQPTFTTKQ